MRVSKSKGQRLSLWRTTGLALALLGLAWGGLGCSSTSSEGLTDAASEHDAAVRDGPVLVGDSGRLDVAVDHRAGPALTELVVSPRGATDASAHDALVPAFSPQVNDYYVRCALGANAFTVSWTASPGALGLLLQPTSSPSLPKQTIQIHVDDNQAIVVAATDGQATTEYWVRCLPPDFPGLEWTPHPEAGVPTPGYYLVGEAFPPNGNAGYAMVLNASGVPVWYYRNAVGFGPSDVDAVVRGAVSFLPFSPEIGKSFEVHQLEPFSTTLAAPVGYATDLHELQVLSNGDYLVFADLLTFGVDLTGLEVPVDGGTDKPGPGSIIEDCAVVEFNPLGNVVWKWLASDHFDAAKDSTYPLLAVGVSPPDGGEVYDPFHCNSIDIDPTGENLLISARHMDSIFYVDRPSGRVVWKMGGPTASLDDATYVSVKDPFHRQHDARLMPGWSPTCNGGSGQISVFDDETSLPGPARAVLYDVTAGTRDAGTDAGGCPGGAGKATTAWQYAGTIASAFAGSFRIGNDGSRVIGWGAGGATSLVFSEVDANGKDLVDFAFPGFGSSYRAVKVPLSAFDLATLRNTAGVTNPP